MLGAMRTVTHGGGGVGTGWGLSFNGKSSWAGCQQPSAARSPQPVLFTPLLG